MSNSIKQADNSSNIKNANIGTPGTNKQYAQKNGNKGTQLNPNRGGKISSLGGKKGK